MFTGIIQSIGQITRVDPVGGDAGGVRIRIDPGTLDCADIVIGDSIAVGGACLTVVARTNSELEFDVSAESLRCTVGLAQPGKVNLEKALRFGDRLGGHLVAGHVDGVGMVTLLQPAGESHELEVEVPAQLARFIAAHHAYETPEIVQVPLTAGSTAYLRWLDDETKTQP